MGLFNKFKKKDESQLRREKSNSIIKSKGIACMEELPVIKDSSAAKIKSTDDICKRAVACLLSIQLALDIFNDESISESKKLLLGLLDLYEAKNSLLPKEKSLFDGNHKKQDVIDLIWTYEAYWSLVWALGLIEDISDPDNICDCERAIKLVGDCENFEEFKGKCSMRDIKEILDMFDLYYRYHWACVENRINPDTPIGDLDPDVVVERRRGLEWLFSDEEDWNDISLDT